MYPLGIFCSNRESEVKQRLSLTHTQAHTQAFLATTSKNALIYVFRFGVGYGVHCWGLYVCVRVNVFAREGVCVCVQTNNGDELVPL